MTAPSPEQKVRTTQHTERVAFEQLSAPGTYVANETGNLFRIPEDGLVSGRSPLIEIVAKTPVMLTKLSADPWLPISKARQIAADTDLYVNF